MGGRIFNPLQCSCEALYPEIGLGCKATVLPTVTNFNLDRFPSPAPTFPPGVQAELISGFQSKKPGGKSKHSPAKPPRGRLRRTALSYFSCCR